MQPRRRGVALITVLMLSSIFLMMVVALYISLRGGLFGSVTHQRRTAALYVAEAGLADAMESLEGSGFATPAGPLTGTLSTGTWQVVFNTGGAPFGALESVNNLAGAGNVESYRGPGTVPSYSALLIVVARVGGEQRVVEAVVSRGGSGLNLTNAIQSDGRIRLRGDVYVNGIKSLDDGTPVAGNIHSNAASGTTIDWDGSGSINISGTVSAQGGAINLSSYTPGGGPPTTGSAASFPPVDIPGTIGTHTGDPAPPIVPIGTTSLPTGDYYYNGDLTLNGDLQLNGATLYVDGELNVNGSVVGDGSVYVADKTSLKGDALIRANAGNSVSLYSHGSVTLSGFDGDQFLESMATADPTTFGKYYNDAKLTLQETQSLMNNPAYTANDFLVTGGQNANLDMLRRTLGQSMPGAFVPGRQLDTLGKMNALIAAQPAGPSQAFVQKKVTALRKFFAPSEELPPLDDNLSQAAWEAGDYESGAALDGMLDESNAARALALFPQFVTYTNNINFDKLGSAYFRGTVYTNGYIHATSDITVLGAILAKGDPTLPAETLPDGTTANPGDLILDDGTRVTFVEDLYSGGSPTGSTVSVETWFGR